VVFTRSNQSGLQFPVQSGNQSLIGGSMKIEEGATAYLHAVLEYLTAEMMELSGNSSRERKGLPRTTRSTSLLIPVLVCC
jgi:histone H2A